MKNPVAVWTGLILAASLCGYGAAQVPVAAPPDQGTAPVYEGPVVVDWTPPALAWLSTRASAKESFTLDRTMLAAAAGMLPDDDAQTRQAINRLDGLSVRLLRFPDDGLIDENAVDSIRAAYHLRGWKHLVTTTTAGGPMHDGTTDVWLVLDGVNVRGAVVLTETPKSLTLVTVAGNVSPVDLLHLRGHLGIPRYPGDRLRDADRR